jgi:hypothetical protein
MFIGNVAGNNRAPAGRQLQIGLSVQRWAVQTNGLYKASTKKINHDYLQSAKPETSYWNYG